ncbi:hypothetical protein [Caulobacter sp. BE254]|uniref:alpha/beta hydrolase family protein n=1 Tax=Caulobacter sp. BE254 TaxID=2817720 RepID=UPI00286340F8|nr:hypothetical protein [Caulobacter sp. BE254]MDR7114670.1 dienelactone hydrolase [Caulobacter sp. BE254]
MAVEKPFAGEPDGALRGAASECSRKFNEDFTAERWLFALQAGLAEARGLPWGERGRTLVLGHSEGSSMAAMVAGHDPTVTDVIFFAGPGVTPYYAGIASDYQSYRTSAERAARVEEREAQVRAIFQKPDSVDDFAWGHPYKRWASFYRLSSVDELSRSKARVYIGIAMSDENVAPLATEALGAELLVRGKDVTVRRIQDADHGFNAVEGAKGSLLRDEYSRAFTWFWDGAQKSPSSR